MVAFGEALSGQRQKPVALVEVQSEVPPRSSDPAFRPVLATLSSVEKVGVEVGLGPKYQPLPPTVYQPTSRV